MLIYLGLTKFASPNSAGVFSSSSPSFQKEVNRRKFSLHQTSPHIERGLNSKSQRPTTFRAFWQAGTTAYIAYAI